MTRRQREKAERERTRKITQKSVLKKLDEQSDDVVNKIEAISNKEWEKAGQ